MSLVMRPGDLFKAPNLAAARVAHMTAAFAGSDLVRGAIALATSLVIARGLGRDDFGRWTFCMTWIAGLTLAFDLGFGVLLTRDAARGRVGALLAGALTTRLIVFLPFGVILYAGAAGLWMGDLPREATHLAAILILAGMAYGCLAAVYRVSPRRLVAILTIDTVAALVRCAGAVLMIGGGTSIVALLRLMTAVQIAQCMAAFVGWRAIAPDDRFERPSLRSTWTLLRRAFPFALTGLVSNAQARMAPLMLGYFSTAGEIASFGVASRLESAARRLPHAAFGAALPVFAHEQAKERPDALRLRFDGAVRWFAIAAAVTLVAGAKPIVRLSYGDQFAAAWWPLVWAGIGLVPSLVNSGRRVYLNAVGRERTALAWTAVALAVQMTGAVVFVPRFGAAGAMWALALGEVTVWLPLKMAAREAVKPDQTADKTPGLELAPISPN